MKARTEPILRDSILRFRLAAIAIVMISLLLPGCRGAASTPDFYYAQIQGVNLRIPGKFGPMDAPISSRHSKVDIIFFMEQDFKTFERWRPPKDFRGLSDNLKLWVSAIDQRKKPHLPNFAKAWADENREPVKNEYGLSGYRSVSKDDANYLYRFEDGMLLYMTCKSFNMPNPGCEVTTSWRGLSINYVFRHHHLSEWRDIHQRITNHLNSFIYQT